jgi:DNA repair photolyase
VCKAICGAHKVTRSTTDETLTLPGLLAPGPRTLPVVGEQSDITYLAARARTVLNNPASTGMGYWSINPYVGCAFGCAYCYARYAHRYALERAIASGNVADELESDSREMPPWLAFERRILVKENGADVLRATLRQGSDRHLGLVRGDSLVIGTATDPYQPAERRFRITRQILEVLCQHPGLRVEVITKSPLVTRDVDLLLQLARHSRVSVHVSLITVDRELARRIEPRSPTPESRLRAVRRLSDAGVDVGVFCMPVLPGITDRAEDLDALARSVAEAGATHFAAGSLRLRATARERYLPLIAREFPHLELRYRRAFAHSHELAPSYRNGLRRHLAKLCRRYGIPAAHGNLNRSEDNAPDAGSEGLQLWDSAAGG